MSQTPLEIPVHYDFASTLCYVAHRTMERLAPRFGPLGVVFDWTPIDLAGLLNWKRGDPVEPARRANVAGIARELGVAVRIPTVWLDSRRATAVVLALADEAARATWRERVFTAIFEEGRPCDGPGEVERLAAELSFEMDEERIEAGLEELERRTRAAAEAMVTGVPTFMLAQWPMGGIQDDDTMLSLVGRFARRQRGER